MTVPIPGRGRDTIADQTSTQRIHGYCALCIARCGTVATVEGGRFTRLDPDPAHPTGQALCAKGRAAPELVYHPEQLTHPLRRTRPKGEVDPGWERISWDTALERHHRPRTVPGDPGGHALSGAWPDRLRCQYATVAG